MSFQEAGRRGISSEGSTALIETIFKYPSIKPCGAPFIDAVPGSIRKTKAAARNLGLGDMIAKRLTG